MSKRCARQILLIIIVLLVMSSFDHDVRFRILTGMLAIGFSCVLFVWGDYDK